MSFPDINAYTELIYGLPERYASIQHSTLALVPIGRMLAKVEGKVVFKGALTLDVWELVDWDAGRILNYSYEIYRAGEKIAWYDPFEHPHISELSSTFPHHKHIQPDLKHHRIPAPGISFERPNLPYLIEEIERELLSPA